jgi:hypothetical protein
VCHYALERFQIVDFIQFSILNGGVCVLPNVIENDMFVKQGAIPPGVDVNAIQAADS